MKKLLFLISVMLLVCKASAQVKVGVEAGVNLSRMVGSSSLPSEKTAKVGGQMGVNVDYEFKNRWMLMSGLTFVRMQGELELGENYNGASAGAYTNLTSLMKFPEVQSKINYLQVPLKLGYHFRLNERFSVIPSVGAYFAYGVGAGKCDLKVLDGETGEVSDAQWKPLDGKKERGLDGFRKWDWGAVAGVKAVWNQHYTLSLDYAYGVKKALSDYGLRNSGFRLSIGYRF